MITTKIIAATCRCGQIILTGYAEGLPARVDPHPINASGHISAVISGRWCYALTKTGLVHLDSDRVGSPTIRGPILATHRCGNPIRPEHLHHTEIPQTSDHEGIPF